MAWKGRGVVTPSLGGVHATHASRTQVASSRKTRSSGTTPCSAASTLLLHTRDAVVATRRRRRERVGARCESSDSPPTGSSRAGAALPAPHEEGAAPHGRRDDGGALGLVEGESVSKSQDVYLSLSEATEFMAGKKRKWRSRSVLCAKRSGEPEQRAKRPKSLYPARARLRMRWTACRAAAFPAPSIGRPVFAASTSREASREVPSRIRRLCPVAIAIDFIE